MPNSPPELVVAFKREEASNAIASLQKILDQGKLEGLRLNPMFSHAGRALKRISGESPAVLELAVEKRRFFTAVLDGRESDSALDELQSLTNVETAYWKPGVENPLAPPDPRDMGMDAGLGIPGERPSDFRAQQSYLDAAPGGVDIAAAWDRTGGDGSGIKLIDIEGGWCFTHSDLLIRSGGLLAGAPYPDVSWRNHGTAVLGQIGGDKDAFGVSGMAPEAILCAVSHGGLGSARAIEVAASQLSAGDVMLLEMHRPGPKYNFEYREDQLGYIAVEWWPDDFLAIQAAVSKGIVVIEAAGNGAQDFADALYNKPGKGFPSDWRNPLQGVVDSGAIIVGAGAPPGGMHGPDRSRLDFSNYGVRVDCQGWGRGVVTTGYGDKYRDRISQDDQDYWYTGQFSGTSSASPIVAAVVASLQGIAKAKGTRIDPRKLREQLRMTGSPQMPGAAAPVTQNIGRRPHLPALIAALDL